MAEQVFLNRADHAQRHALLDRLTQARASSGCSFAQHQSRPPAARWRRPTDNAGAQPQRALLGGVTAEVGVAGAVSVLSTPSAPASFLAR